MFEPQGNEHHTSPFPFFFFKACQQPPTHSSGIRHQEMLFLCRGALVDPRGSDALAASWPLHGWRCIRVSQLGQEITFLPSPFFFLSTLHKQKWTPLLLDAVRCQNALHTASVHHALCVRTRWEGETHQQHFICICCDQSFERRQRRLSEGEAGFELETAGEEESAQE